MTTHEIIPRGLDLLELAWRELREASVPLGRSLTVRVSGTEVTAELHGCDAGVLRAFAERFDVRPPDESSGTYLETNYCGVEIVAFAANWREANASGLWL